MKSLDFPVLLLRLNRSLLHIQLKSMRKVFVSLPNFSLVPVKFTDVLTRWRFHKEKVFIYLISFFHKYYFLKKRMKMDFLCTFEILNNNLIKSRLEGLDLWGKRGGRGSLPGKGKQGGSKFHVSSPLRSISRLSVIFISNVVRHFF